MFKFTPKLVSQETFTFLAGNNKNMKTMWHAYKQPSVPSIIVNRQHTIKKDSSLSLAEHWSTSFEHDSSGA